MLLLLLLFSIQFPQKRKYKIIAQQMGRQPKSEENAEI